MNAPVDPPAVPPLAWSATYGLFRRDEHGWYSPTDPHQYVPLPADAVQLIAAGAVPDTGQPAASIHPSLIKLREAAGRAVDYGPAGPWRTQLNEALIASHDAVRGVPDTGPASPSRGTGTSSKGKE